MLNTTSSINEEYEDPYFTQDSPTEGHRDFAGAWATEYDNRRFQVELDTLLLQPADAKDLLDVGAASGAFVRAASSRGWRAVGVEPSFAARSLAAARGTPLLESLSDLPDEKKFDAITCHHVLEHVPQPLDFLRELKARLAADGRMLIEVPNWRSGERYADRSRWVDLRLEQHRWFFEPKTLENALRTAGFRVVRVGTLGEPIPTLRTAVKSFGIPVGAPPAVTEAVGRRCVGEPFTPSRFERVATIAERMTSAARVGKRLFAIAAIN